MTSAAITACSADPASQSVILGFPRNVLGCIHAGGNIYYLAKFVGIFHLNVQDIGAQQTGMTVGAFKAYLKSQA